MLNIAKQQSSFIMKSVAGTLSVLRFIKLLTILNILWISFQVPSLLEWRQRSLKKPQIRTWKDFSLIMRIKAVPKGETLTPSIGWWTGPVHWFWSTWWTRNWSVDPEKSCLKMSKLFWKNLMWTPNELFLLFSNYWIDELMNLNNICYYWWYFICFASSTVWLYFFLCIKRTIFC